jgi:hypothetical protein
MKPPLYRHLIFAALGIIGLMVAAENVFAAESDQSRPALPPAAEREFKLKNFWMYEWRHAVNNLAVTVQSLIFLVTTRA